MIFERSPVFEQFIDQTVEVVLLCFYFVSFIFVA